MKWRWVLGPAGEGIMIEVIFAGGIKPECRSRRLTARCIRRHGRHLGTPACHVYRTGAANGGTGPGMEWSWVMCPAGGLSASLSVTVSSRRWTA